MTLNEVLALALAWGPTKFVGGPLAVVVDLVRAGGLLEFYTYLVLAQGRLSGLIGLGEVLFMQNEQNYTERLFKMRASLQPWLYSSLVYASGLFVGVDQAQSLHHPDTQLQAKVEYSVPLIAPVLIPIFGPLGLLQYPTKPVSMAVQVSTVSIFTYRQGSPTMGYEDVIKELLSGEDPQVYTAVRTEQQAGENFMGLIRARARKATVLPRELGTEKWYNAPVDLYGQPFRFPLSSETLRKRINASLRASPDARSNYHF